MKRKRGAVPVMSIFLLFVTLTFMQLQGCGGSGGSGGSAGDITKVTTTGTLNVAIGTAPIFDGLSSAHVKVLKVVAVPAGMETASLNDSGMVMVASYPDGRDVDILKLSSTDQFLGSAEVPAENYTQIRLLLAGNPLTPPYNNYAIVTGRTSQAALTTPGEGQKELVLNKQFTVVAGQPTRVALGFDGNQTVGGTRTSGAQYSVKPGGAEIMLLFQSFVNSGSINGSLQAASFSSLSSATISVRPRNPDGETIASGRIFGNYSSSTGWTAPFIAFVPPNGTAEMPSTSYRIFVWTTTDPFKVYSSPLLTVKSKAQNTPIPNPIVLK